MQDNITILIKRGHYYNEDLNINTNISEMFLEYGEFIYLEDLNYLVLGRCKQYKTKAEAQAVTSSEYKEKVKYLEYEQVYIGGPVICELIANHDYYSKASDFKVYGVPEYKAVIDINDSSDTLANTRFVGNLVTNKIANIIKTEISVPSNCTVTGMSMVDGALSITYSDIKISYDQVEDSSEVKRPLPSDITPLSTTQIGEAGVSENKYSREDHRHPLADCGDADSPVYAKDGALVECNYKLDVNIKGVADSGALKLVSKTAEGEKGKDTYSPITVGSSTKPVYISNGIPTECGSSLTTNITGNLTGNATTATTASKLGSNAGSSTKPVYFNNGVPVTCNTQLNNDISGMAEYARRCYSNNNIVAFNSSRYVNASLVSRLMGDVNGDGRIDINDSLRILNYLNGSVTLSGLDFWAADLGLKNEVTFKNAMTIQYYINKIVTSLSKYKYVTYSTGSDLNGYSSMFTSTPLELFNTSGSSIGYGIYRSGYLLIYSNTSIAKGTHICFSTVGLLVNEYALSNLDFREDKTLGEGKKLYLTGVANNTSISNQDLYFNTAIHITTNNVLKGAAWNDLAEYREGTGDFGQVVCEDGRGELKPSSSHLQKCPYVVSDTFGFAIGETATAKLPVAISGRVLVNCRDNLKVGDVVCAGKYGCAEKMSRLETILFPDRILGVVSEIPNYSLWNNKVKVNERIWIKLR